MTYDKNSYASAISQMSDQELLGRLRREMFNDVAHEIAIAEVGRRGLHFDHSESATIIEQEHKASWFNSFIAAVTSAMSLVGLVTFGFVGLLVLPLVGGFAAKLIHSRVRSTFARVASASVLVVATLAGCLLLRAAIL